LNKYLKYTLLVSLLIAFISTISYCSAPFDTETASHIDIRKTVSGEGYILRTETVVRASSKGAFESAVLNGVRVSRGSNIGVVISGNYNEELVLKLKDVTKRIEEIEKSNNFADIYSSDEARIFSALKDISSTIRKNVRDEDYITASENTSQLSTLLEKKFSAENQGAGSELLMKLQQEKYELEQRLGGIKEDVRAPASGLFYSELDGLEKIRKESELFAITPSEIENFPQVMESFTPDAQTAGKVTDTYAWYLTALLPPEEANLLTVGKTVTLRINELDDVKATVCAINSDETEKCAVVIKCTHHVKDIYEKRMVEFEICYEEYSGLYVPSAAIRVVDGVTGVYVLSRNETVSFRCVKILLQEEKYYIVKSNYTPPEDITYSPLKLYDNILVNPEVAHPNELESKS